MDKLGIISDIHGNYPALKEVINILHNKGVHRIICLGDIVGYYCMVNECIELLLNESIYCLKGNHDSYILGEGNCGRSNSVNKCIEYQKSIIKAEYLEWLKTLEPIHESSNYVAMHGGFNDYLDEYVENFDFNLAKRLYPSKSLFMSGHTHKQNIQENNEIIYFNPGSVGQPRDYDSKAAFAIIQDGIVELHRIEYPIYDIVKSMVKAGFNQYYYENLYYGCKLGEQH